jgi:hypothetical protein
MNATPKINLRSSIHLCARFRATAAILSLLLLAALPVCAVDVLEDMNNPSRTGENSNETILNAGNVNVNSFGKLWSYSVTGATYAQPLYASSIGISGGTHNVVFIETMEDDAYCFDADSNTKYWEKSFTNGSTIVPFPVSDWTGSSDENIVGDAGIESTPYINKSAGVIYMVSKTKNTSSKTYAFQLHALNITNGAEMFGGPVTLSASGFSAEGENQRMGLAMANGNIIITMSSYQDQTPYNGWLMAYNATTLSQVATFNVTPTGSQGAIWQQGRAAAVDGSGNVYVITANGTWDGSKNFSESILKLSSSLSLEDWFTPDNYATLTENDEDLGSGGPLLIPGTATVMGGGKQGEIYLCNTGDMGHEQSGNGQIIQSFSFASGEIHGGSVYYHSPVNGPVVYDMANGDNVREYSFNGSTFNTSSIATSSAKSGGSPGGFLAVSDNNGASGSGIVWASVETSDDDNGTVSGIVRAWNADNLGGSELWDSSMNSGRDSPGNFVKDANPTVANGKVYIGSYSSQVSVYGLLSVNTNLSGEFQIENSSSGYSLNVMGAATTNGAPIIQWSYSGAGNELWTFIATSNGYYQINSVESGKDIVVQNASTTNEAKIIQWTFGSSGDDQWEPVLNTNGTYTLFNLKSGKVLDDPGDSKSAGTQMDQYSNQGEPWQQWDLIPE